MRGVPPQSLRIPGADGLSLHVLEWSAEGVPLLLLHGFGNEAHVWDDFAPALAPYYRVLALDHRGHGESDRDPEARYDHDAMVRDVEAVTEALGATRLVVVGHSLGGRIATLFAGRHPERLAGLVLVDIGPEVDPRGMTRIGLETRRQGEGAFGSVEEYAALLTRLYPAARPEVVRRMARHGLRERPDGRLEVRIDPALRAGVAGETAEESDRRIAAAAEAQWEALARVACPALVVRGAASDILAPDVADRMVEEVLPDARLAVVARAGHSVMVDNPEGFRDAVCAFALGEA